MESTQRARVSAATSKMDQLFPRLEAPLQCGYRDASFSNEVSMTKQKQAWTAPKLQRLVARGAETGAKSTKNDGKNNKS